jgi:hypothetical protein
MYIYAENLEKEEEKIIKEMQIGQKREPRL